MNSPTFQIQTISNKWLSWFIGILSGVTIITFALYAMFNFTTIRSFNDLITLIMKFFTRNAILSTILIKVVMFSIVFGLVQNIRDTILIEISNTNTYNQIMSYLTDIRRQSRTVEECDRTISNITINNIIGYFIPKYLSKDTTFNKFNRPKTNETWATFNYNADEYISKPRISSITIVTSKLSLTHQLALFLIPALSAALVLPVSNTSWNVTIAIIVIVFYIVITCYKIAIIQDYFYNIQELMAP